MPYKKMHLPELQHAIATADDKQAYAELFNRYYQPLVNFSETIVHQKEIAEEIVSDVFVNIWQKRKTIDQVLNFKMYLYVSARNFSVNVLRSKNHQVALKVEKLTIEIPSFLESPHEKAVSSDLQTKINLAINELPDRCKAIFKLVKEDGLKQKEVAEILQLSQKTVENQLAIALHKLAISLDKQQFPIKIKK